MPVITCIEDLRQLAEKRVPRMFYDYADSGSWTETTYRANESDFQAIKLRQRVAVNMEGRSTAVTMVGQHAKMPVAIAPVGLTGMQHADGEIHAARAAEKFGIPFKCSALVLTLDLQVIGQRHKDLKNGLTAPPRPTLANIINLMTKPRWCLGMAGTRRHTFRNLVGHVKGVSDMRSLSAWTNEQFDPRLSWADIAWVKEKWGGKLILKGIMDVEDAKLAVQAGADAIVVSNHGGRQLDGAPSSIHALPAIVAEVGSQTEVWMDGGIRAGQDVLKAWALGARGTMIGRAMAYGLGAMGEDGVTKALQILHKELDVTMAFCGHTQLTNVTRDILVPGTFPVA